MYLQPSIKKQQGNIILIILAIVAIIGLIAAYMMSGNTNTSSASTSSGSILGASMTSDGSAIQQTYQTLVINGHTPASIVFIPNTASTATAPNVLDPATGMQDPVPNANALFTGAAFPYGAWIYNPTGVVGYNIGTAAADNAVYVTGIKDSVCQQINSRLYGSTTIPALATASATWQGTATALAPTSAGAVTLPASTSGWMAGCVATSDGVDHNVYFQIVQAN